MSFKSLLKYRNQIYGICAIWIVLFHIYRKFGLAADIPGLMDVLSIGNLGVDIFLFFSGFCLYLSAERNNYDTIGWSNYYRKRVIRLIPSYLIVGIPFYLWNAFVETTHNNFLIDAVRFGANISSMSFWLKGNQTTWFVYGMILLYVLFPRFYKLITRYRLRNLILILITFIVYAIVLSFIPVLNNAAILWSRIPIFFSGVVIAKYRNGFEKRISGNGTVVSASIIAASLCAMSCFDEREMICVLPVVRWLSYGLVTICIIIVLLHLTQKNREKFMRGGVFQLIGKYSLEIYLVHITLLHPIQYYGIFDKIGYWLYLLLPIVAVLISIVVGKISNTLMGEGKVN